MADGEDIPGSPPLPKRGAYNIDFDALDESSNPFESNIKLGSSPPIRSSSAYKFDADDLDNIDPFKPSSTIGNSPPGSPKAKPNLNNNNINGPVASDEPLDVSNAPENAAGQDDAVKPAGPEPSTNVTPKKKKVLKKPKVQSKIKRPQNIKPPEAAADEIQIFMPGEEKTNQACVDNGASIPEPQKTPHQLKIEEPTPAQAPAPAFDVEDGGVEKKVRPSSLEEEVPCDPAPEAMVSSSEMDSQFVNTEDLDDFSHAAATEAFIKPSKPDVTPESEEKNLSKNTADLELDDAYPTGLDLTVAKEKVSKTSSPQQAAVGNNLSDDGSPAMKKSPRGQQAAGEDSNQDRHPAARVLEAASLSADDTARRPADIKNESSSEENTFYDAEEFPPPPSSAAAFNLGQKNSTPTMQGSPAPSDDMGAGKGTMVQLVQVLRYSQSDWNKLKQELELSFQATLLSKEREWSALLGERDKRLEQAEENNKRLRQTNEDMRTVVAEFEKTISQLQAEKERHKKDLSKTTVDLERDRDQAVEDLQSVESAFSDLHRRYEKSKGIIEGFKKNEEQLKQHVEDLQAKLKKSESKLLSLRSQAEEKLDRANEDIEQIKRSTKSDMARLEAALKKSEIRICTLEESLQRKEKENEELTSICDELIAKVGS